MQIVIDIDEEDYKRIRDIPDVFNSLTSRTYSAIRNGTPLTDGEEISEKEKINQLKYMTETFGCKNKDIEKGFVGGLFYAVTLLEHGKEYADSKIDWDYIGREDEEYVVPEEKETGCSSC